MPLTELNHYFVRAKDLQRSRHFYCDILSFEEMPRPNFSFPGYWLGVNGKILVHTGLDGIADSDVHYFGTTVQSARNNSGVFDHIAFLATEPEQIYGLSRQPGVLLFNVTWRAPPRRGNVRDRHCFRSRERQFRK